MKGFIALITVLIILGIIVIAGLGIGLLSVGEASMGFQQNQSSRAYYLAYLCAEDALMKLKENPSYSGNETINIDSDNCQIERIEVPIGGKWTINTSGNFQNQKRKMKIVIAQIDPEMIIDSWSEVADF